MMNRMHDHLTWQDPHTIERVIQALRAGQIVASTTDTVIGLMTCATQKGALALDRIKSRERKPYIILAHDAEQLKKYVTFPDDARMHRLIAACWPGPLTLILPLSPSIHEPWARELAGIAVRIPDHAGLQAVTRLAGAIFSTSANKSGQPVCRAITQLHSDIQAEVSLCVDDAHTTQEQDTVASTIIDCTGDEPRIVREGAYPIAELERIWGKSFKRA